jgi:hypothetical protein
MRRDCSRSVANPSEASDRLARPPALDLEAVDLARCVESAALASAPAAVELLALGGGLREARRGLRGADPVGVGRLVAEPSVDVGRLVGFRLGVFSGRFLADRQRAWRRAASVLCASQQDRSHQTSALRSCPPVQGANRSLRKLKTFLGRVIRDIKRRIVDDDYLKTRSAWLLNLAGRVRDQERGQHGPKVYSLHAPEVECIGKGKSHKPYEFGVKASAAPSSAAKVASSPSIPGARQSLRRPHATRSIPRH